MAFAAWMVPLTLVLQTHHLACIQPYAFATTAVAAFVTPLFFGAVADRHAAPARVLRWLAISSAASLLLVCLAIRYGWNPWLVLGLIQVYALCFSPITSISTAVALAAMRDPWRQFGPIRAMGTFGWMAGCWLVSLLNADRSIRAALSSAALWLALGLFTYLLRNVEPPASTGHLTWHERLGLDALTLLKKPDHRVIFLATTLVSIPLAAFYTFTPPYLRELGFNHPSAWMSLGQTTELIAMFTLGALVARWRLKWIVAAGLAWVQLRVDFRHGANLRKRPRGAGLARARPSIALVAEQRRGQPLGILGRRLVVCRLHAQPYYALAGILGLGGRSGGHGAGIFSNRVSRKGHAPGPPQ